MLATHARTETLLTLRNGEQILLTLLIPLGSLIVLTLMTVISLPEPRIDSLTPRIFALAVLSSAFTGQAIALGFDRRYGVLKRLAATALPTWLLVAGRALAGLAVVAIQLLVLGVAAALLGWSPSPAGFVWALTLVILGTLTFGALGVLLGGALKADVVLALANIVWFVLLFGGGIVVPASSMPGAMADVVALLPSAALADGLRMTLVEGLAPGWSAVVVLGAWGSAAALLASRTTRLS